jgi:hypothetical protein
MVFLLPLWFQVALAHPFQPSAWSMKTQTRTDGDRLELVVALEVPTDPVLRALAESTNAIQGFNRLELERARDAFNDTTWRELGEGIELTIDGTAVGLDWQPVDTPINGKASERFFLYLIESSWQIPTHLTDFSARVSNTAYVEQEMFLTASTQSQPPWSLHQSSARTLLRGGVCWTDGGPENPSGSTDRKGTVWLKDDQLRTLEAHYSRAPR